MRKLYLIVAFILHLAAALNAQETKLFNLDNDLTVLGTLVYSENFDSDLSDWVLDKAETTAGGMQIINQELDISVWGGTTVWCREMMNGPVIIEYDIKAVDEGGSFDRVSDLNCYWMASALSNRDFFENIEDQEDPSPLILYYTGMGGHTNSTNRFRRFNGDDNPLLPEHDLSEYLIEANRTYHIRLVANGHMIRYYRDDQLIHDFYDESPYTSGYFGFRTTKNHMTADNFKIYTISTTNNSCTKTASSTEAECYDDSLGIQVVDESVVGYIENGDWASYSSLNLTDMNSLEITYSSGTLGGSVEVRLDAVDGLLIGKLDLANTGGWDTWETSTVNIERVDGLHDIFLVFTDGDNYLFNIDKFGFSQDVFCDGTTERIEAECYDGMFGIQTETCSEGTENVGYINNADWLLFQNIDLTDMQSIKARVACDFTGGMIEVRTGSESGTLIGEIPVTNTGGNQEWETDSVDILPTSGVQNVYFVCTGGDGYLFNINWFEFSEQSSLITSLSNSTKMDLTVYPNPTTGVIHLTVETDYQVINSLGQIISSGHGETIDLTSQSEGIYYIKAESSIYRVIKIVAHY